MYKKVETTRHIHHSPLVPVVRKLYVNDGEAAGHTLNTVSHLFVSASQMADFADFCIVN